MRTNNDRVFLLGMLGLFAVATIAVMSGIDYASAHQGFGFVADAAAAAALDKKTVEDLATEVKSQFQKSFDAVKDIAEKALAEAAKGITMSDAQKGKVDETLTKMNTLGEQLATLEQKVLEGTKGGPDLPKTMGEMFVGDDKVKSFLAQANPRGRIDLQVKTTLSSLTTDAGGSVGSAIAPTRLPGILELPSQPLTVRSLLTPGQMDGNTLEYVRETGFTNNAGMVAELAAKPESDFKLDDVSTTAKVIAHYTKASRQVMSDIPQLRSMIDGRLLYGLALKEEAQLLNGDGTGQNLLGIIPQATGYAAPMSLADLNIMDVLRLAMLQASLALYPASGHVMNPIDWTSIETLKDTTGRHIIGNPQGSISPTMWGLPVVVTPAITVRKFLTGAFRMGAQIFDRWAARVELSTENEDDFIKNRVTILAEERLALAVYRPGAFIYGDFDTALAG